MSCKNTQLLLDGYLDGELDAARNMEIEAHLESCPACAQVLEQQQHLRASIQAGAPYFKSPAGLERRVRAAVRKASREESGAPALAWRWPWNWLGATAAVAAAVVLAVILVPRVTGPSREDLLAQEVVSSHVRSLMASHLVDVPSSDSHTVKPWFDGKLDFAPPVNDLQAEGFPLVGGRLDYVETRAVAALVYQRRKHFINLFIWPAAGRGDVAEKDITRQGYNVARWTRAGMTYWAVSDLSMNQLQEFVQLMQK